MQTMTTTREARKAELEAKIAHLEAQEQEQRQELLALEAEIAQETAQMQDAQKADVYHRTRSRGATLQKRDTHTELLRVQARLAALQIEELDDVLPEHRAVVERLQEQRKKLDAEIEKAQRPLHDLEGQKRSLQLEFWRLTHEAEAFKEGSKAL